MIQKETFVTYITYFVFFLKIVKTYILHALISYNLKFDIKDIISKVNYDYS